MPHESSPYRRFDAGVCGKADLLVVVATSLPIEDGSVVAKEYGWDDVQLRRHREGRSKAGILGRVIWIIRRP